MEEIIKRYLDKNYLLVLSGGYFFRSRYFYDSKDMPIKTLITEINCIFASPDEFTKVIIWNWAKHERTQLSQLFDEYIKGCIVVLGRAEWIAQRPDGTPLPMDIIKQHFYGVYDTMTLETLYKIWFEKEMYNTSERMMGIKND